MQPAQKISVVFPVYNEENNLEVLYESVKKACTDTNIDYEMIFVDNGSNDNSLHMIKKIRISDDKVKFISLSRNFGHQNALFAGMSYATGDAVITMDADLQHPPSLISEMVNLWRNGVEVVYTVKKDYDAGLAKLIAVKTFYWIISKISRIKLYFGQSDFRLLDRKVLKAVLRIPDYHKFLRGQVEWVGFRQQGLTYNVGKRYRGKSKFSYKSLFSFALDGMLAFSRYPLHLVMYLGIIGTCVSTGCLAYNLFLWVLKAFNIAPGMYIPPGYFTLAISILFLGSMQLIAISIVGEYVGRVYDQAKGRPSFIVRETSIKEANPYD